MKTPKTTTALRCRDGLAHDPVNHPKHYTKHPSGVECITVTEHMNFCLGNAMKYIWRAGEKGDALEDLKKARWYLDREIGRRAKPLTVAEAQQRGVCRFCKKDNKPRGKDDPFLLQYGLEYAHQKCLEGANAALCHPADSEAGAQKEQSK